jgi:hypothetical protein
MGPIKEPRSTDHEGGRLGAAGWRWRGLDGGHGSSMLPRDVASTADRCLLGPYPAGTCPGDSEHATYRDVRALGSSRSKCGPGYAHRQHQPQSMKALENLSAHSIHKTTPGTTSPPERRSTRAHSSPPTRL